MSKESSMSQSWKAFERTLHRAATEQIAIFSRQHRNEKFYGFLFNCNAAENGEIGLCTNTEHELSDRIRKHYPHYGADQIAELRWNPGDWQYQGFNGYWWRQAYAWNRSWRQFARATGTPLEEWADQSQEEDAEGFNEQFMESVCRTLVALEEAGAFAVLPKSESFCTFAIDHEEGQHQGWLRLARMRLAMSSEFPAKPLAGLQTTGEQPQLAQAYLAVCADLFDRGETAKAWHLAAEALRLAPQLVERMQNVASIAPAEADGPQGIVLPLPGNAIRALSLLARVDHFVFGKGQDNRLADVNAALQLVPDFEPALLRRAEIQYHAALDEDAGELVRLAVADFDRLLQKRPNDLALLRQRAAAHIHRARRDYVSALADYERILPLAPPKADDYSYRAWALQKLGRFEEAVGDFGRAIEMRGPPAGWDLGLRLDLRNRGKCYFRLGHYEEALRDFVAAFDLEPHLGDELLLFQSQTLAKLGRLEEADAAIQRARKRKADVEQHYANWLLED